MCRQALRSSCIDILFGRVTCGVGIDWQNLQTRLSRLLSRGSTSQFVQVLYRKVLDARDAGADDPILD